MGSRSSGSGSKTTKAPTLPAYLRPQLRLFLTADIVGSTAYKQRFPSWSEPKSLLGLSADASAAERKKHLHPAWFAPIADFYAQTQTSFHRHWADLQTQAGKDSAFKDIVIGKPPSFWKAIGDEIAFSKRLENAHEAIFAMVAWIKTLEDARALLQSHSQELDVKSAAWLAGFPVRNTEVIFAPSSFDKDMKTPPEGDDDFVYRALSRLKAFYDGSGSAGKDEAWIRDFVGPSIDTGFRIAGKATPRKFMISVELANLLHHAHDTLPDKGSSVLKSHLQNIQFRYDGREQFKGVMGNTPYPLIWIDLDSSDSARDALNAAEDEISGTTSPTIKQVGKFCDAFIRDHPKYLVAPYICDAAGKKVHGERPPDHGVKASYLAKIDEWFRSETKKIADENAVMASPELQITGTTTIGKSDLASLKIAAPKKPSKKKAQ